MGMVYVVTFYYENYLDSDMCDGESTYGIYSSIEKAKEAAVAHEQEEDGNMMYHGYSITEWELDTDNGALRDV